MDESERVGLADAGPPEGGTPNEDPEPPEGGTPNGGAGPPEGGTPNEATSADHILKFSGEQWSLASFVSVVTLRAKSRSSFAAASRKAGGQSGSAGSGHNAAQITARHAASGRRAHQMCSVEICPCRMDFSRRACAEMRLMGRSTSMRRLG